jgi:hypothetical protein
MNGDYLVQENDGTSTPVDLLTLAERARSGSLSRGQKVYSVKMGDWYDACDLPEIATLLGPPPPASVLSLLLHGVGRVGILLLAVGGLLLAMGHANEGGFLAVLGLVKGLGHVGEAVEKLPKVAKRLLLMSVLIALAYGWYWLTTWA